MWNLILSEDGTLSSPGGAGFTNPSQSYFCEMFPHRAGRQFGGLPLTFAVCCTCRYMEELLITGRDLVPTGRC